MSASSTGGGSRPSWARDLPWLALVAVAYFATARLGLKLAYYQSNATLVWAPSGLAVAALWLRGRRMAIGVALGAFFANVAIGSAPLLAMAIACGNTAEAIVAHALVRRAHLTAGLRRVRDVVLFLGLVVLAATAIAAANGVLWLTIFTHLPHPRAATTGVIWWLGDAGGVLVVTPLILAFARPALRVERRAATELALLGALVLLGTGLAFGGLLPAPWSSFPVPLLPYPLVVWAALRFGMRGATAACATLSAAAVLGTAAGTGPFHYGDLNVDVAGLWLFLATISTSSMLLAASLEERVREAIARREREEWLGIALSASDAAPFERDLLSGRVRAYRAGAAADDDDAERWGDPPAWEGRMHPDDRAARAAALEACRSGAREAWEIEYRVAEDGGVRRVLERGRVVERDAHCVRAVGLQRDVTERHRAEEERRALERELQESRRLRDLGMLAGGIAHDFNNLLTVVRANTEIARHEDTDDLDASLDAIDEAATRAAELTEQLLAYAGRRPVQKRDVDLAALAAETARMLGGSLPPRIAIQLEPSTRVPLVEGDPSQLRQVLMNLVLNAAEAIPEPRHGTVTVRVASDATDGEAPSSVRLEVADDGCGMDDATTARVFEPFFTTKPRGRGLGMAAVLGIVRAHRGRIDVESHVGVGTTFRVWLPATARLPQAASERTIAISGTRHATSGRRRVLVVDDEPGIRSATKALLSLAGYDVTVAESRDEARRKMDEAGPFDLVLVDLTMPGANGAEVVSMVRARAPSLPVVVMSGYSEDLLGDGLENLPFLQKPFREPDLLARVREAMAGAA